MVTASVISEHAKKSLRKIPRYVVVALETWRQQVKALGLNEVRKIPGYHDETLNSISVGLRSIRLNSGYRAYYRVLKDEILIEYIFIEEVNKHEYEKIKRRFR